jgi:hypothetical protein
VGVSDEGIGAAAKFRSRAPPGLVAVYPTMSNLISIAVLTAIANAAQFFIAGPPRW